MSQSQVLVTGGSGFIGTHLCRALVEMGHAVRVLDIKDPGDAVPGVQYVRGDVRNSKDVEKAVEGIQTVFHFAAMVSVPLCHEKPVESYETNLLGVSILLDAIRQQSLRTGKKSKIIFASSAAVYGNTGRPGVLIREREPMSEPLSFYAAQKLGSEQMIRIFHRDYGIPSVVFRFFNVYGPGQDPQSPYSGVISVFKRMIEEGRNLKLNGGGIQTRDFVAVQDIVRACVLALGAPDAECDGRPMNLGSGEVVTIRELSQIMIAIAKAEILTEVAPPREGDVMHSRADIERAQRVLGWIPQIGLREGLTELIRAPA